MAEGKGSADGDRQSKTSEGGQTEAKRNKKNELF